MVVIIDDRADVWEWSPNLVKVIPCKFNTMLLGRTSNIVAADDFFVGIGDINSAFLPKLEPTTPPITPPPPPTTADPSGPEPTAVLPEDDDEESDLEDDLLESDGPASVSAEDELAAEIEKDEMISRNTLALEAQVEARPLAKMQEELQELDEPDDNATLNEEQPPSADAESAENGEPAAAPEPKKEKHVRKALLKNDDIELVRVQQVCLSDVDCLSSSVSIMRRFSISFTSGFTPHMTHTNPRNISLRRKRSDTKPLSIMTSG